MHPLEDGEGARLPRRSDDFDGDDLRLGRNAAHLARRERPASRRDTRDKGAVSVVVIGELSLSREVAEDGDAVFRHAEIEMGRHPRVQHGKAHSPSRETAHPESVGGISVVSLRSGRDARCGIRKSAHPSLRGDGDHLLHGDEPLRVRPRKTHSHGIDEREPRRDVEMPRKHTELPGALHPHDRARAPLASEQLHEGSVHLARVSAAHL